MDDFLQEPVSDCLFLRSLRASFFRQHRCCFFSGSPLKSLTDLRTNATQTLLTFILCINVLNNYCGLWLHHAMIILMKNRNSSSKTVIAGKTILGTQKDITYTYLNSEYRGPQLQLRRQKCPIGGSTMKSAAQLPTYGRESCLLYKWSVDSWSQF